MHDLLPTTDHGGEMNSQRKGDKSRLEQSSKGRPRPNPTEDSPVRVEVNNRGSPIGKGGREGGRASLHRSQKHHRVRLSHVSARNKRARRNRQRWVGCELCEVPTFGNNNTPIPRPKMSQHHAYAVTAREVTTYRRRGCCQACLPHTT